jgi:hypothetical protein
MTITITEAVVITQIGERLTTICDLTCYKYWLWLLKNVIKFFTAYVPSQDQLQKQYRVDIINLVKKMIIIITLRIRQIARSGL